MRRPLLAVVLALAAAACGSGTGLPDGGTAADGGTSGDGGTSPVSGTDGGSSSAFVGTWSGTTTLADGRSGPGTVVIVATGASALGVGEICGTGNVPATVTSATAFTLQATACAPGTQAVGAGSCTLQYQVSGGTGTLSGAQLSLSVTGTVVNADTTACPSVPASQALDWTLVATKK